MISTLKEPMKFVSLLVAIAVCLVLSSQAVTAQSAAQRAAMRQQQMASQRAAQQAAAAQRAAQAAQRAAMQRQREQMQRQLAAQRDRMRQLQRQQMQRQRALQQKRMEEMRRRQMTTRRNAMQKQRQTAKEQNRQRLMVQQLLGRKQAGAANDNKRSKKAANDNKRLAPGRTRAAALLKQKRFENAKTLARERLNRELKQRRNREDLRKRQKNEKKRREDRLITAVRIAAQRAVPKAANDNRSKFNRLAQLPRRKASSRGDRGGKGRRGGNGNGSGGGGNGGSRIPAKIKIDGKQFAKKMARKADALKVDVSSAKDRLKFRSRIQRVFKNADEVRSGTFAGQGAGGGRGPVFFFKRGRDLVLTTPKGEFVTFISNGASNTSFLSAKVVR